MTTTLSGWSSSLLTSDCSVCTPVHGTGTIFCISAGEMHVLPEKCPVRVTSDAQAMNSSGWERFSFSAEAGYPAAFCEIGMSTRSRAKIWRSGRLRPRKKPPDQRFIRSTPCQPLFCSVRSPVRFVGIRSKSGRQTAEQPDGTDDRFGYRVGFTGALEQPAVRRHYCSRR